MQHNGMSHLITSEFTLIHTTSEFNYFRYCFVLTSIICFFVLFCFFNDVLADRVF